MFRKLLVPLDRSTLAEQALGPAAAIARGSKAEIDVMLVHQPIPFGGFADAPWNEAQAAEEEKYLESIATELTSGGSVPTTHAVVRGDVIELIRARAQDVKADLIVMTSHGRTGLSRAWLGSVADGVLRQSAIPVLMLRPIETKIARLAAHSLFKRVLVPLDGSVTARGILPTASALALCSKAQLILLYVVQPVPLITPGGMSFVYAPMVQDDPATQLVVAEAEKYLAGVARTLASEGITDVATHVVVASRVAQEIIDFGRAHDVDVVAMSTHGRGASRLVVGSVADKVLRASRIPVLLNRPAAVAAEPDFVDVASITRQLPALQTV
jgi:nucleotide-binding universal stress UspA family protein